MSVRATEMGSWHWKSPETVHQGIFTQASDVWSFGGLLFEITTLEIPYAGLQTAAIISKLGKEELPDMDIVRFNDFVLRHFKCI